MKKLYLLLLIILSAVIANAQIISVTNPTCPGVNDGSITYYSQKTWDPLNLGITDCDVITTANGLGVGPQSVTTHDYTYLLLACSDNLTWTVYSTTLVASQSQTILGCADNIFVSATGDRCNAYVNFDDPVHTFCSGSLTITYEFTGATIGTSYTSEGQFNVGETTVSCIVDDGYGTTDTCTFVITVTDDQLPFAVCQDITVELDNTGNAAMAAIDIDNGSNDNCIITYGIDPMYEDWNCADVGDNTVVLTVTDQGNNTATCESTVTVEDNIAPIASCQNVTVFLDENGYASVTAYSTMLVTNEIDNGSSDACGIASYELDNYDFSCADVCSANCPDSNKVCPSVVLTVTDVNGNTATCSATVTVIDNVAPNALCQNITVDLADIAPGNGTVTITANMIDNLSNDACGIQSVVLDDYDFNCSDVCTNINGDVLGLCPTVVLTVTDNNCNTSTCQATVTVRDNSVPHAIAQDVTVYLDSTGMGNITATGGTADVPQINNGSWDNCAIDTLFLDMYDFYCSDIYELVSDIPVVLTAVDVHGNSSTVQKMVTVKDTIAPAVMCQDVTVYLSDELNGSATITADKTDVLNTWDPGENNVLSDWWDNCDISTSLSRYVFNCGDIFNVPVSPLKSAEFAGPPMVTLTVTDEAGNTGTCNSMVTVLDTSPPHVLTQDIEVCLDDNGMVTITPDQINDGSWDNCSISNMYLDETAFHCVDTGINVVTLTVWDSNGNSASETANVLVKDCTAPVVNCLPFTVELYENGEYVLNARDIVYMSKGAPENPTWDNCTPYEQLKITIFPRSFECIHVFETQEVTVYATDVSGNTGMCKTTIKVIDNIAPVMACRDIDIYLDAKGKARIFPGDLNDGERASVPEWARTYNGLEGGSYDACGIDSAWVSQVTFNCSDVGMNEVTLSMIDPSYNLSTCTSMVTVHDTFPPHIELIDDITVEVPVGTCETSIDYPEAIVSGNCGFMLELTEGLGVDGMFPLGTTTETWVATSTNGITAEITFNVTLTTTNDPPTLDAISDVAVDEDIPPVTVPLTGISGGMDCVTQDFTVDVTGTNPELVTSVVIKHTEGSETGSVILTVAPNMSGSAEITVMVEDSEGASVADTFMITVNPVNDAPYVVTSIPDQMVNASYELELMVSSALGDIFDDIDDDELSVEIMVDGGALPAWAMFMDDKLTLKPMIADTGCVTVMVKATDAAGASASTSFELCVEGYPVSIGELETGIFEVHMYPNPTRGTVNLDLNSAGVYNIDISVMDITGRVVVQKQYAASDNIIFDMSDKVSGMYFVQLNVDGKQIVKKLVVDRK